MWKDSPIVKLICVNNGNWAPLSLPLLLPLPYRYEEIKHVWDMNMNTQTTQTNIVIIKFDSLPIVQNNMVLWLDNIRWRFKLLLYYFVLNTNIANIKYILHIINNCYSKVVTMCWFIMDSNRSDCNLLYYLQMELTENSSGNSILGYANIYAYCGKVCDR